MQEKIERIIDHEMQYIGASKLALSSISSEALWDRSGRLAKNPELLRLVDRKESKFILSPTHEEEITTLASGIVKSYKDLPIRLYQVSRKYRDELRPRQGLLRAKEFLMKDLYTFDLTEEDAMQTYADVKSAYTRIFDRLGLEYLVAEADSGNMGGNLSHEYQLVSPIGEDTLFNCTSCGYVANEEVLIIPKQAKCPKCHNDSLQKRRAIEVGHTFHLGTRYSKPLAATVADRNDKQISVQMGCHGIGISRIIAAAAALRSFGSSLRWPLAIAPFKSVIICDPSTHAAAVALYDKLEQWSFTDAATASLGHSPHRTSVSSDRLIIDDRNKSIGWKLKDADLIGYPVVFVLGSKFKSDGTIDVIRQDASGTASKRPPEEHEEVTRMIAASTAPS